MSGKDGRDVAHGQPSPPRTRIQARRLWGHGQRLVGVKGCGSHSELTGLDSERDPMLVRPTSTLGVLNAPSVPLGWSAL